MVRESLHRSLARAFGFEPPIVATLVVSTHGRVISQERLAARRDA
jgi:hypothetical protein